MKNRPSVTFGSSLVFNFILRLFSLSDRVFAQSTECQWYSFPLPRFLLLMSFYFIWWGSFFVQNNFLESYAPAVLYMNLFTLATDVDVRIYQFAIEFDKLSVRKEEEKSHWLQTYLTDCEGFFLSCWTNLFERFDIVLTRSSSIKLCLSSNDKVWSSFSWRREGKIVHVKRDTSNVDKKKNDTLGRFLSLCRRSNGKINMHRYEIVEWPIECPIEKMNFALIY